MKIIPAIIPNSTEDLNRKLELVKGLAEMVHIDFVDSSSPPFPRWSTRAERGGRGGKVIEATTPSQGNLPLIKVERKNGFFLEAHLMLPHPEEYIAGVVRAGFARVLVHTEDVSPEVFAELIHEWRGAIEVGAVLEIETPLLAIDSFAHELKTVQLMSIAEVGAQGRPFDPRVLPRISTLHMQYPHLTIAVDGGVNKKNAAELIAAGATRLVVGSALKEFYG